jgi:hypothetical protein
MRQYVGEPMRARLVSLVARPTAPPLSVGLAIAASLIIAETLVLCPLKVVAPESALGVVYLLGVVVVAIVWGLWLAAATCVVSVLAFDFFHIPRCFVESDSSRGLGRGNARSGRGASSEHAVRIGPTARRGG